MSRKRHEPTAETRHLVNLHATVGTRQDTIAKMVGVDAKTLRLYYADELELASAKANGVIGGALFNKAKGGDTAAMIFWMKTRAGWRETNVVEHTGKDGGPMQHEIGADAAFQALAGLLGSAIPRTEGSNSGADSVADDSEA